MINNSSLVRNNAIVIFTNIAVCALLYSILITSAYTSIAIIAVSVGLVFYLESKGLLDKLFETYSENKLAATISLLVLILIFPFLLRQSPYLIHILVMSLLYAIVCLGLNFQLGSNEMVNFAAGAFMGMGAYSAGMLSLKLGVSPWLGIVIAVVASTIFGYIIGLPTLRTKGYYLSLVTIALQFIFYLLLINTPALGGPNGLAGVPALAIGSYSLNSPINIFGMRLPYQVNYYFLGVILLAFAAVFATRLYNSRIGLAWNASAEDETGAVCQGINLTRSKLLAFCIGGAFSGLAGAVYAHYITFIGPEDFNFMKSLIFIAMVIMGGMDNVKGTIAGAVILTLLDQKLIIFSDQRMLLYGVIILVMLLFRPEGLLPKKVRNYHTLIGKNIISNMKKKVVESLMDKKGKNI